MLAFYPERHLSSRLFAGASAAAVTAATDGACFSYLYAHDLHSKKTQEPPKVTRRVPDTRLV